MQGDGRCQRQVPILIFSNLYVMYFDVALLRDRTLVHSPSFCFACVCIYPHQEPSYWTITTAFPAAWSPLLRVHVQTSSPAALENARHEVSHYFLFPASSSSWHTLLQFKPQMSDVIVQSFQTQPSGVLQCLCSLSDLYSTISILHLARTLRHWFHFIFQWNLSSVILNWLGFLSRCFQSIFKNKD